MKIFRLENTKGDSSSFLTNKELRLDNSYKNDLTKNKPEILSTARVVYINEILVSESPFNFESTTPCPFKEILKGCLLQANSFALFDVCIFFSETDFLSVWVTAQTDLSCELIEDNSFIVESEEVLSSFGLEHQLYREDKMKIKLVDLKAMFIDGNQSAITIPQNQPIKLNDIDCPIDNLDPEGIEEFKKEVKNIITGSRTITRKTKPDPISALLMNADTTNNDGPINKESYELFERSRLADKWRGNRIGELNELMACMLPNISKSSSGELDLVLSNQNIIAELKKRFNTMNAASAIKTRKNMEELVFNNSSKYKGYKAILVERVPKSDGTESLFCPSDPDKGMKTTESELILRKGFQQFLEDCGGPLVYLQGIVLIATVLVENQLLPNDYDMRFIFSLLQESIT